MSFFQRKLDEAFTYLWRPVIRPPREEYSLQDLGPSKWSVKPRYEFERRDLQVRNAKGQRLECSHYWPVSGVYREDQRPSRLPCVVYLHSSMGSRLEMSRDENGPLLESLLVRGITVFTFDHAGSGLSDGEFISVGLFEELDLKVVLEHLRSSGEISRIGLWGRSMGAITAIFRMRRDLNIEAAVVDTAFTSLKVVAEELAAGGVHVQLPSAILTRVYDHIAKEIKARAGFEVTDIAPIEHVPHIDCPVLFAFSKDDTHVQPHHTQDLHDAWGGTNKQILEYQGDHWDERPMWFCCEACDFLEMHVLLKHWQADAEAEEREEAVQKAAMEKQKAAAQKVEGDKQSAKVAQAKSKPKAKAKVTPKAKPKAQDAPEEAEVAVKQQAGMKPLSVAAAKVKPKAKAHKSAADCAGAANATIEAPPASAKARAKAKAKPANGNDKDMAVSDVTTASSKQQRSPAEVPITGSIAAKSNAEPVAKSAARDADEEKAKSLDVATDPPKDEEKVTTGAAADSAEPQPAAASAMIEEVPKGDLKLDAEPPIEAATKDDSNSGERARPETEENGKDEVTTGAAADSAEPQPAAASAMIEEVPKDDLKLDPAAFDQVGEDSEEKSIDEVAALPAEQQQSEAGPPIEAAAKDESNSGERARPETEENGKDEAQLLCNGAANAEVDMLRRSGSKIPVASVFVVEPAPVQKGSSRGGAALRSSWSCCGSAVSGDGCGEELAAPVFSD